MNALETWIQLMRGATWMNQSIYTVQGNQPAPSTPAVVTWGAPGELIQIVWDQGPEPTTATIPAVAAKATLVNMLGQATTIFPVNGTFQVALPPATVGPGQQANAPIGGEPYYVIQDVPLGADGTQTTWFTEAPSAFPVEPAGQWAQDEPVIVPPGPVSATVNTTGDQVVIQNNGQYYWETNAGTGPDQLNMPVQAVVGAHQWVYVDNFGNSDILIYRRNGTFFKSFGGYGTGAGQLLGPSGIAIGPTGIVYVTNAGAETVVAYTPAGQYLWQVGGWGSGPGQFDGPDGIVVGANGDLYVADTLNNRIVMLTPDGQYVTSFPSNRPTQLQWAGPTTLRVLNGMTGVWTTMSVPGASPGKVEHRR
jgi:hypothetical protein